ncbi:MAG: hypothetical protein K6E35_07790 [Bacteroidales bacterium]|nr:hypothetical protein [Bacteroidales bacterium]
MGRGSAKTTDCLTERMLDVMQDMPGAPCAWVSDTFVNLTANVIPTVLESLERKGYREGVHYIIEREPPQFKAAETADLQPWLRDHFWRPRNRILSWNRTMVFYTGMNLTFGSLDRPSTLAGRSYVHVFGDEAKYFKEDKISNLLKAVRGYPEYSGSVFYRGVTFTSDVGDPSRLGEYDWMAKYAARMDVPAILLVIKAGLVYHECMREYLAAKDRWLETQEPRDLLEVKRKLDIANDWGRRWRQLRLRPEAHSFYLRASSFVNADILTPSWFTDAVEGDVPDLKTAILSMRASLDSGDRFYAALTEDNFYYDGIDEQAYDQLSLRDTENCSVLRHLDTSRPLRLGVDFGNMCSMVIGQEGTLKGRPCIRALKFLYTLPPDHTEALGRKFREYFAPMRNKVVYLYYDRAGNQYRAVRKDAVSELKRAIEIDGATGRRSGWTVVLMSANQGTISQSEEYHFMLKILGGESPRLPKILIDWYACKPLRCSLQLARTKVKDRVVHKDKSSERLPAEDLPLKSTNPSDAFKYFLMSKDLMAAAKDRSAVVAGNLDPLIQ